MGKRIMDLTLPFLGAPVSSSHITIEDAAALLAIERNGVYQAIQRGHIEKVAVLRGPVKTADVLLYGIRQGQDPVALVKILRTLRPDISMCGAFSELARAVGMNALFREVVEEILPNLN